MEGQGTAQRHKRTHTHTLPCSSRARFFFARQTCHQNSHLPQCGNRRAVSAHPSGRRAELHLPGNQPMTIVVVSQSSEGVQSLDTCRL